MSQAQNWIDSEFDDVHPERTTRDPEHGNQLFAFADGSLAMRWEDEILGGFVTNIVTEARVKNIVLSTWDRRVAARDGPWWSWSRHRRLKRLDAYAEQLQALHIYCINALARSQSNEAG